MVRKVTNQPETRMCDLVPLGASCLTNLQRRLQFQSRFNNGTYPGLNAVTKLVGGLSHFQKHTPKPRLSEACLLCPLEGSHA